MAQYITIQLTPVQWQMSLDTHMLAHLPGLVAAVDNPKTGEHSITLCMPELTPDTIRKLSVALTTHGL